MTFQKIPMPPLRAVRASAVSPAGGLLLLTEKQDVALLCRCAADATQCHRDLAKQQIEQESRVYLTKADTKSCTDIASSFARSAPSAGSGPKCGSYHFTKVVTKSWTGICSSFVLSAKSDMSFSALGLP